jgi:hypothetical protein
MQKTYWIYPPRNVLISYNRDNYEKTRNVMNEQTFLRYGQISIYNIFDDAVGSIDN